MKDLKELRAPAPSKKWKNWKNWKNWESLHPQRNERNERNELRVPTPSKKWKKWKKRKKWKNWESPHPQRNEINEINERIESPYILKEMKEINELRAPSSPKKWMKWEGPHFQRNERNLPPYSEKKWFLSFLSWPGLNHNGSLGWPRPIWNSMVATTVPVVAGSSLWLLSLLWLWCVLYTPP